MKAIETNLLIGSRLKLANPHFGLATVKGIRPDSRTKQTVCEVRTDHGESILLTLRYANSRLIDPSLVQKVGP